MVYIFDEVLKEFKLKVYNSINLILNPSAGQSAKIKWEEFFPILSWKDKYIVIYFLFFILHDFL